MVRGREERERGARGEGGEKCIYVTETDIEMLRNEWGSEVVVHIPSYLNYYSNIVRVVL